MVDPAPARILPQVALGLTFAFLLGALPLILHRIEQTELTVRQGLIHLELRLERRV